MSRTIKQHRKNIQDFANKHKLVFEDKGKVGVGRDCVGLLKGDKYIDYCPINMSTYKNIKDLDFDILYEIAPKDAYHKHDCLAVLGHSDKSIIQLSEWVDALKDLNAEIVKYKTGATGIQAMFSGVFSYAVIINK